MAKLHYAFIALLLVLPLYVSDAHSHHRSRESRIRPPPGHYGHHLPPAHHHPPPVHYPPHVHHPPPVHYPPPHVPHVIPGHGHSPFAHPPPPPRGSHHRSGPSLSVELGSRHGHGGFRVVL
ncbi:hypothetical protein M514_22858 [Trichuris suis]|uniref:Uncharacterized protein n=1 Tax=Trichuris suis TaxID=68888 RepID=A0A085N6B3_9BILA|nr:hypothetical protein M514_22858 [Trichuris suis]